MKISDRLLVGGFVICVSDAVSKALFELNKIYQSNNIILFLLSLVLMILLAYFCGLVFSYIFEAFAKVRVDDYKKSLKSMNK